MRLAAGARRLGPPTAALLAYLRGKDETWLRDPEDRSARGGVWRDAARCGEYLALIRQWKGRGQCSGGRGGIAQAGYVCIAQKPACTL